MSASRLIKEIAGIFFVKKSSFELSLMYGELLSIVHVILILCLQNTMGNRRMFLLHYGEASN